jgi:hypothetical protein
LAALGAEGDGVRFGWWRWKKRAELVEEAVVGLRLVASQPSGRRDLSSSLRTADGHVAHDFPSVLPSFVLVVELARDVFRTKAWH